MLVHRGWVAFWGVTGIAAGVVTFLWPSITALALLVVIATWAFLIGGSRIAFAIARAQAAAAGPGPSRSAASLLVLLGVLLVVNPGAGALGITWAIGWFAVFFGATELWLASVVRHETHELTTHIGVRAAQRNTR